MRFVKTVWILWLMAAVMQGAWQRTTRADEIRGDPDAPDGFVVITNGAFLMGAPTNMLDDGAMFETPRHTVHVSEFFMEAREVTKSQWDDVRAWAVNQGYTFDYNANGKAANHPVHTVDWFDAVKWCNARSEQEGWTPAYYTSTAKTAVYRAGRIDLSNVCVNWYANGYRLPTEAEWEKAARGGAIGRRLV